MSACVYTERWATSTGPWMCWNVYSPTRGHELKHGWIKYDSDLDPLRNHPRFQKILELIG